MANGGRGPSVFASLLALSFQPLTFPTDASRSDEVLAAQVEVPGYSGQTSIHVGIAIEKCRCCGDDKLEMECNWAVDAADE